MTAKEYLSQAMNLDKLIRAKHEEITMLKNRAQQITPNMTTPKVKASSVSSPMSDAVDGYIDRQRELARLIKRFHTVKKEIEDKINNIVSTSECRDLLKHRYVDIWTWKTIAQKMNYSTDHVRGYLHWKALRELKKRRYFKK